MLTLENQYAYHNLIYINIFKLAIVQVKLNKVLFMDSHFPQSIINSLCDANEKSDTKSCQIELFDCDLIGYNSNRKFFHWENGFKMFINNSEYYDFSIILNNSLLVLRNLNLLNSSRFILANKNNKLNLENINIQNEISLGLKNPPEMIYLLVSNMISLKGLNIYNSSIFSFDDDIEPNMRDQPIFNAEFSPSTLLKFEKNQAIIAFGMYNLGDLINIKILNSNLNKRENFALSFIDFEYSNALSVKNLTIGNFVLDSQSRYGVICVFYLSASNNLNLSFSTISELRIYGYSITHFCFLTIKNTLNITSSKLLNTYFRSKSTLGEVDDFYIFLKNNPGNIFYLLSERDKTSSLILSFAFDYIIMEDVLINDTRCLQGCILCSLYAAKIDIYKISLYIVMSETVSSVFSMGISNSLQVNHLKLDEARGNTGAILVLSDNYIIIENSELMSSWATAGSYLSRFFASSAILNIATYNKLVIHSTLIYQGNSDKYGGVFMAENSNVVELKESNFTGNKALFGGVSFVISHNSMSFFKCVFIDNYGVEGGVFYVDNNNNLSFKDCSFNKNRAEVASVFYFIFSNILTIENAILAENLGFVLGGMILISGTNQELILKNVQFLSNQPPFKGFLIEINKNNTMVIDQGLIDYGDKGNGNFLFLDTMNKMRIEKVTIRNINNIEVFIKCNSENEVNFLDVKISSLILHSCFLFSKYSNKLNVFDSNITNTSINDMASGLLNINYLTLVHLANCIFSDLNSRGCLLLRAHRSNIIKLEGIKLTDINLIESGTCIILIKQNQLNISNVKLEKFYGFSNEIFFLQSQDENKLHFTSLIMTGNFSIEQLWNITNVLNFVGDYNVLYLTGCSIKIENPNPNKIIRLDFIKTFGARTKVRLENSQIKLLNFYSFFNFDKEACISIQQTNFMYSKILGDFIILKFSSLLTLIRVNFFSNMLFQDSALIRVSGGVTLNIIQFKSNTIGLFLFSKNATILIEKSSFVYTKKGGSFKFPLFILDETKFSLEKSDFFQIKNNNGSILSAIFSSLMIRSCIFGFNIIVYGGTIYLGNFSELLLISNKFLENQALFGGVLKFENVTKLIIEKNYFFANKAFNQNKTLKIRGKGGCFYASIDTNQPNLLITIKENIFVLNGAEMGGIAFLHDENAFHVFKKIALDFHNFIKQTKVRFYGLIMASYSSDMKIIKASDLNKYPQVNLKLMGKYPFTTPSADCIFQVITIDLMKQVTYGEYNFEESKFHVSPDLSIHYSLKNSFPCFNILIPNSSYSLKSLISHDQTIDINSSSLSKGEYFHLAYDYSFKVTLSLKKCQRGEFFNLKNLQCENCEPNFFSFDSDFVEPSSCKSCAPEPFYCYGGFNLTPKAGFWRTNEFSKNFMSCPFSQACLGDLSLSQIDSQTTVLYENFAYAKPGGVCALGYEGILCSVCQTGYAKVGGEKCELCSNGLNIFFMFLKVLIRVFLYYYTIYKALKMCWNVKNNKLSADLVYSNFFIKIIIIHIQFLKCLMNFPLRIPTNLRMLFNLWSFSISSGADKVLNLECFINFAHFPASYIHSVINILAPLIVASSLSLIANEKVEENAEKCPSSIKTKSMTPKDSLPANTFRKRLKTKLSELPFLFIIALMLNYDETLGLLMNNFSAINIDDESHPEYRLVTNLSIDFYSFQHRFWIFSFALPATIVLGILLPFYIIYKIFIAKQYNNLKTKQILLRFGYFFFAYNDQISFYEASYFLRKVFLISIDTFFLKVLSISKIYDALTFAIIICFFYTLFSIFTYLYRPYNQKLYPILNKIESLSITTQTMTMWIACLLLSFSEENNHKYLDIIHLICFLIASLINIVCFFLWFFYYWRTSISLKFKKALNKIKLIKRTVYRKRSLFQRNVVQIRTSNYIDDESSNINKEDKSDLFFPPHFSHRLLTWREQPHQAEIGIRFFLVIDKYTYSEFGKVRMDIVWDHFENPEKNNSLNNSCIKLFSFSPIHPSPNIKSFSKNLIKNNSSACYLEIKIEIEVHETYSELKCLIFQMRNQGLCLSSFISFGHTLESKWIKLRVLVNLVDTRALEFSNTLRIIVYKESVENQIFQIEIEVFIFEFFDTISQNERQISDAFSALINQGIEYSSDSRALFLSSKTEKSSFQIIKSKSPCKGNKTNVYFFRIKPECQQVLDQEKSRPFLNKFLLE